MKIYNLRSAFMKTIIFFIILILPAWLYSQQIPDTTYNPDVLNPIYGLGEGSLVFIDGGHHNSHTKNGGYKAFSNLLERDGYNVKEYSGEFTIDELETGKILVIANAINEINVDEEKWYLPNPSAFTTSEIKTVKDWVNNGGNLFLIADHMPLAGAAEDLAKAFGFEFTNGFVFDTLGRGVAIFNLDDQSLTESIITKGRDSSERVNRIVTFTGQGFKIPDDATPILTFDKTHINVLPDTAWVFDKNTTFYNAKGMSQGAYKKFGKGRIVVFGEAAMFTAQIAGPKKRKMGMNNAAAPENHQLLLNIIHWLDGKLE